MKNTNDKYTKLLEEMDKRFYTSMMDEYKRVIHGKSKEYIFATPEIVIDEVAKTTLKDNDTSTIFEGMEFKTEGAGNAYVRVYTPGVRFTILFRTKSAEVGNQYHTYEYTAKSIKGKYTKLYYTHTIKSDKAILGFNGKLGAMKFKKEHKKQAFGMFKFLKNKLEIDDKK